MGSPAPPPPPPADRTLANILAGSVLTSAGSTGFDNTTCIDDGAGGLLPVSPSVSILFTLLVVLTFETLLLLLSTTGSVVSVVCVLAEGTGELGRDVDGETVDDNAVVADVMKASSDRPSDRAGIEAIVVDNVVGADFDESPSDEDDGVEGKTRCGRSCGKFCGVDPEAREETPDGDNGGAESKEKIFEVEEEKAEDVAIFARATGAEEGDVLALAPIVPGEVLLTPLAMTPLVD